MIKLIRALLKKAARQVLYVSINHATLLRYILSYYFSISIEKQGIYYVVHVRTDQHDVIIIHDMGSHYVTLEEALALVTEVCEMRSTMVMPEVSFDYADEPIL